MTHLKLLIPDTPFTHALLDDSVVVDSFDVTFDGHAHSGPHASSRLRGQIEPDICGAEQAIPDYLVRLARRVGQPLVALPIFPTRGMVHGKYVARPAGPEPRQLHGGRVGISRVLAASVVYLRGVLTANYGLDRERVTWLAAESFSSDEALGEHEWQHLRSRLGVRAPDLLDLLARDDLDAVLYPGGGGGNWFQWLEAYGTTRSTGGDGTSHYGHLESLVAERGLTLPLGSPEQILTWFSQRQVYPLFHFLAIHREVAEQYVGLVEALVAAFSAAAGRAVEYLSRTESRMYEREMEVLGVDPNATGLTPLHERSLAFQLDVLEADGIVSRRPSLQEIFPYGPDSSKSEVQNSQQLAQRSVDAPSTFR